MTRLAAALADLREDITAGRGTRTVDPAVLRDLRVEHGTATATPAVPVAVADLEKILGAARRLPRNPSGGDRTVLFIGTVPAEGESGATVLAEIDDDDRVRRVIVRADAFRDRAST